MILRKKESRQYSKNQYDLLRALVGPLMNENTRYGMRRSKLNSSSAKGIRAVQRAMVESKFDTALAGTEDTRRTRLVSRALCGMAEWPCSSGTCPNGLSSVVGRNVSQASWRSSLGFGVAGESNSLAASSSVRSVKVGSSELGLYVARIGMLGCVAQPWAVHGHNGHSQRMLTLIRQRAD